MGEKKHTQFGSLFKLHTCADHKKRPVKALPGKPQQPVCFYKHTHIKYRDTHKFMCDLTTRAGTTHTSLIILPCIAGQGFHPDRRRWSKAAVADGAVGFPTRPEPAEALQHSDFPEERWSERPPKLPEAFQCRVFTALVNVFVLGKSSGGLWRRCAERSSD